MATSNCLGPLLCPIRKSSARKCKLLWPAKVGERKQNVSGDLRAQSGVLNMGWLSKASYTIWNDRSLKGSCGHFKKFHLKLKLWWQIGLCGLSATTVRSPGKQEIREESLCRVWLHFQRFPKPTSFCQRKTRFQRDGNLRLWLTW